MKVIIEPNVLKSLLTLATVIEARDPYTGGHTWRVSHYARLLAEKIGLGKDEVFVAQLSGLVHDIGKIGVPDAILNKPGKLDDKEYTIMKNHPEIGNKVIANHPLFPIIKASVTEHHEKLDGSGYPHQLNNKDLSIIGKIASICDAFDAMTSTRPYRKGMPLEKALAILDEERGKQFEATLVDSFKILAEKGELAHILGHSAEDKLMLSCPECGPIIATDHGKIDGDEIECPNCTGEFIMHKKGETFELEWKGTISGIYIPCPDLETIKDLVICAPKKCHCPDC